MKKEDFNLTPGDWLTLNWGISQYLPLKKDMTVLAEAGVVGYDTWQITDDSGSAAKNVHDQVHAIGGQLGITQVPWNAVLNFHYFYEFAAKDRFQGQVLAVSLAKKFQQPASRPRLLRLPTVRLSRKNPTSISERSGFTTSMSARPSRAMDSTSLRA